MGRPFGFYCLFLLASLILHDASAEELNRAPEPIVARLRASSPRLQALIDEGRTQSKTFRTLVDAIEATDGIVFMEEGKCIRGVSACLEWRVTRAGGYRLLFVRLSFDKTDRDLIASAGHELQHVLEVLSHPRVDSSAAIAQFYRSDVEPSLNRAVETTAAIETGEAVFRELRGIAARTGQESAMTRRPGP